MWKRRDAMARSESFAVTEESQREIDAAYKRISPGSATHEQLWQITKMLPSDFRPYGTRERDGKHWQDCSCGCNFYHRLRGNVEGDWGVCVNPASPRCGLITFEHQGCEQWEHDPRWEQLEREELKILRKHKRLAKKSGKPVSGIYTKWFISV